MRKNRIEPLTKWLLACGVVGGFGFVVAFLIAGTMRPHYDPLYHFVSALSLGDGGWIQISNFVVTGILMVACALGLRRALSSGRGGTWGPTLIGTFGLGLIGAGVFVTDPGFGYPLGTPRGPPTTASWHGMLHLLASVIVFLSLSAACFVFARRFSAEPRGSMWARYSFATGLVVLALIVASNVAVFSGGPAGLLQRLSLIAGWFWVGLLAIRTISGLSRQTAAGQ
jgi:hypothetical membrane protein